MSFLLSVRCTEKNLPTPLSIEWPAKSGYFRIRIGGLSYECDLRDHQRGMDPLRGNLSRRCMRHVYEKAACCDSSACALRLCSRRDGGRLCLEPPAPRDRSGFLLQLGVFFLLFLNRAIPRLPTDSGESGGLFGRTKRTAMLVLAVTIHNIPEGMAVGAVYAGYRAGSFGITSMAAFTLALGIAIQNVPEGAIISMPLCDEGMSKSKAVLCGVLSGAVEPVAALLTLFASFLLVPAMPYFLSFAAGAMFYVVVKELIPEMTEGDSSDIGTVFFAFGFTLMMALDIALG